MRNFRALLRNENFITCELDVIRKRLDGEILQSVLCQPTREILRQVMGSVRVKTDVRRITETRRRESTPDISPGGIQDQWEFLCLRASTRRVHCFGRCHGQHFKRPRPAKRAYALQHLVVSVRLGALPNRNNSTNVVDLNSLAHRVNRSFAAVSCGVLSGLP